MTGTPWRTPEPDPKTLTGFSTKAQAEVDANKFAAATGGLVNLSASTYWELYYAARAWHEHALARTPERLQLEEEILLLETQGPKAVLAARRARREAAAKDQQSATAET